MIALFDHLARPLLRKLDPETAHGLAPVRSSMRRCPARRLMTTSCAWRRSA